MGCVPMNEAKGAKTKGRSPKVSATGTLGKAIEIIDLVANASEPMRFTDILHRIDQPRGTLHRQLKNLVEEGLLNVNRDHSYSLGLRLLTLASKAWSGNRLRSVCEPHMRKLHELTGEAVHLGVLDGARVIYLDKVEARQTVRMHSQIGNASPAYCTGIGKAALSVLPDEELVPLVEAIAFARYTDNTITDAKTLLNEIAEVRRAGTAFDREEHEQGIRCVAAPIHAAGQSAIAAISVTGPSFRVSMEMLDAWVPLVRQVAAEATVDVEARLGPRS